MFAARLREAQFRIAADVRIFDAAGNKVLEGVTRDEQFDTNDLILTHLPDGLDHRVEFQWQDIVDTMTFRAKPQSSPVT